MSDVDDVRKTNRTPRGEPNQNRTEMLTSASKGKNLLEEEVLLRQRENGSRFG